MSVFKQISSAPRSAVAAILNINATLCQEEVKPKLGLWMSGMKRALMMTIGTSTDAIIPKTAQILALRRGEEACFNDSIVAIVAILLSD